MHVCKKLDEIIQKEVNADHQMANGKGKNTILRDHGQQVVDKCEPPVLKAHNVVEDRVDSRTEVVEEAGHMEKVP